MVWGEEKIYKSLREKSHNSKVLFPMSPNLIEILDKIVGDVVLLDRGFVPIPSIQSDIFLTTHMQAKMQQQFQRFERQTKPHFLAFLEKIT